MKNFNLMIAGVGGQGTVLASKLIAAAAIKKGFDARTTETIGMAQRGGSVFGHCRIGENIFSPKIPLGKADAIIAFEPAEAVRQMDYLRDGAVVIVCNSAVKPITNPNAANDYEAAGMLEYLKTRALKQGIKLIIADGQLLAEKSAAAGISAKTLNVSLLGVAAKSGIFPFDADTLKEVFHEMLPKHFLEMNLKAFEIGKLL